MATLTIQLPGLAPVSHVLKDDTITVGRMKGNTIVIDDASVSLTHARITRRGGEFYLKDLNSTNGTVVNGQRINEARLRDLDRVAFADITAQFQAEAAVETGAPAPNPILPRNAVVADQSPAAPVASAAPDPAMPSRSASDRAPAFNLMRLVSRMVAVLGGAVALAVVAFIGWRMFHAGPDDSARTATAPPSVSPAPVKAAAPRKNPEPDPPPPAPAEAGNQSLPQLVKALKNPDVAERRRAATKLHSLGAQATSAGPALREALNDTDQDVRMWAALTLVNNQLHDKATIPILIGVLHRDNPVLRQVACLSLGLIPSEDYERATVVPALTETASQDGDDEVRKAAISALNIIAPDAVAKPVTR